MLKEKLLPYLENRLNELQEYLEHGINPGEMDDYEECFVKGQLFEITGFVEVIINMLKYDVELITLQD